MGTRLSAASKLKLQLSVNVVGPAKHCLTPIVLHTEPDAECDQQVKVVSRLMTVDFATYTVTNRTSNVTCLSHTSTVVTMWPNFQSPELGTKFHREVPLLLESA